MNKRVMVEKLQDLIDGKYESINQAIEVIVDIDENSDSSLPIYEYFDIMILNGEWVSSCDRYGNVFYVTHDDIESMSHWLLENLSK